MSKVIMIIINTGEEMRCQISIKATGLAEGFDQVFCT